MLNTDNTTCGGAGGTGGSSVCNHIIFSDTKNEPSPGFTLRATIDCERDEIYIFSSMSKLKDRRDIQHMDASNSFWVYSLKDCMWSRIYKSPQNAEASNATTKIDLLEPCPRYAHQLVYDDVAKVDSVLYLLEFIIIYMYFADALSVWWKPWPVFATTNASG